MPEKWYLIHCGALSTMLFIAGRGVKGTERENLHSRRKQIDPNARYKIEVEWYPGCGVVAYLYADRDLRAMAKEQGRYL